MNTLIVKIIGGFLGTGLSIALAYGAYVAITSHFTDVGVLRKTVKDQAAFIEQAEAAKKEAVRLAKRAEKRNAQANLQTQKYRALLADSADGCLDTGPIPVDGLLTAVTDPGGIAGLSASAGRAVTAATDSAVDAWRDLSGRGESGD